MTTAARQRLKLWRKISIMDKGFILKLAEIMGYELSNSEAAVTMALELTNKAFQDARIERLQMNYAMLKNEINRNN